MFSMTHHFCHFAQQTIQLARNIVFWQIIVLKPPDLCKTLTIQVILITTLSITVLWSHNDHSWRTLGIVFQSNECMNATMIPCSECLMPMEQYTRGEITEFRCNNNLCIRRVCRMLDNTMSQSPEPETADSNSKLLNFSIPIKVIFGIARLRENFILKWRVPIFNYVYLGIVWKNHSFSFVV